MTTCTIGCYHDTYIKAESSDPEEDEDDVRFGLYLLRNPIYSHYNPSTSDDWLMLPAAFTDIHVSQLIQDWMAKPFGSASKIMWLGGVPDSFVNHKSDTLGRSGYSVVATFTFSTREGTEQMKQMVPTLARQISRNIPRLSRYIGRAVVRDRRILEAHVDAQFSTLISGPLWDYAMANGDIPSSLIVINGLDLYHDRGVQEMVLSTIEMAMGALRAPLRVLFTSRHAISEGYTPPLHYGSQMHVHDATAAVSAIAGSATTSPYTLLRRHFGGKTKLPSCRGFPTLVQTQCSFDHIEAYTRALLMCGHGIPLWRAMGDLHAPLEYLQDGPKIGDVMSISGDGVYRYFFNIFRKPDDPANRRVNAHLYDPLTLDPLEVTTDEHYFKPGEFITSTGVVATKICDNPLTINFRSKEPEGSILVLPDGASREDLVSTTRFHKYVQRWAPYWYHSQRVMNGSLFLVTGCDKTTDYACACFPFETTKGSIEINYKRGPDMRGSSPWKERGRANTAYAVSYEGRYPSQSTWPVDVKRLCVFVRGMRIVLGNSTWSSSMLRTVALKDEETAYSQVSHKMSLLSCTAVSVLIKLRLRVNEEKAEKQLSNNNKQFFHPIFLIGPELLSMYPSASIALVNDSDWSNLTAQGHGTLSDIRNLVDKVYQYYEVTEEDGVISLSKIATDDEENILARNGQRIELRRSITSLNLVSIIKWAHKFKPVYRDL